MSDKVDDFDLPPLPEEDEVDNYSENEKEFEEIFLNGDSVFFLESDGSWFKNTFESESKAKLVYDCFRGE